MIFALIKTQGKDRKSL